MTNTIEFAVNKDLHIEGTLHSFDLAQPVLSFDKSTPVYQVTLEFPVPEIKDELFQPFDNLAGWNMKLQIMDQPKDKYLVRFETPIRPNYGLDEDGNIPYRPGMTVRVEYRGVPGYSENRDTLFAKLVLRGISLAGDVVVEDKENSEEFNF